MNNTNNLENNPHYYCPYPQDENQNNNPPNYSKHVYLSNSQYGAIYPSFPPSLEQINFFTIQRAQQIWNAQQLVHQNQALILQNEKLETRTSLLTLENEQLQELLNQLIWENEKLKNKEKINSQCPISKNEEPPLIIDPYLDPKYHLDPAHTEAKRIRTSINRAFTEKELDFFNFNGDKIQMREFQEIKAEINQSIQEWNRSSQTEGLPRLNLAEVEAEYLAKYLKGYLIKYKTGYIKKTETFKYTLVFLPKFEYRNEDASSSHTTANRAKMEDLATQLTTFVKQESERQLS